MPSCRRFFPLSIPVAVLAFALSAQTPYAQAPSRTDFGVIIDKKSITDRAVFLPYTANGIYMEIIAVRASDGTVRTALNTCQVCYDSGRGYYRQEGSVFVCQNCGNRFRIDQIEKVKGGCNPVPVTGKDKADLGDRIGISESFLDKNAPYFARWKK